MTDREWSLIEVQQAVNERTPDAGKALEWFWKNGPLMDRHLYLINIVAQHWRMRADVRATLEGLRPPSPERDAEGRYPSLMDWLALTDALGRREEIQAWFDERLGRGEERIPPLHRLEAALLERARVGDWLAIDEPVAAVKWRVEYAYPLADLPPEVEAIVREEHEAEFATELAWWRTVAARAKPEQLAEVDALIASYPNATQVYAWLARPFEELLAARLARVDFLGLE